MYTITLLALYIAYLIEDRDGDCQHVGGNVVQFKLLVKDWIRTQLHLGLGNFNLRIGRISIFKVTRKFFLKHNKSFRWHLGDYEKHFFFPFEGL